MLLVKDRKDKPIRQPLSLSTYYPKNTQYFYGYPAGCDSGFVNNVPPEIEELVSMRAISCAGPSVSVISYAPTTAPSLDLELWSRLKLPRISRKQFVRLPADITPDLQGQARNEAIKQALKAVSSHGSLVMAQPYLSQRLASSYQIPADITTYINDKNNLQKLVSKTYTPKRVATFMDGRAFWEQYQDIELPVVVKITSSSSGDGVYICRTKADITKAAKVIKDVSAAVLVEEYVEAVKNYGLHFGIPYAPDQPVDIFGINEQLTSESGEFEGGMIRSTELPEELRAVKHYIEYVCLPRVRSMGWYGIGCFDVLVDSKQNCYIVDSNFRMTGMSAYHFMVADGRIKAPLMAFNASFEGDREALEDALTPFTNPKSGAPSVQMIALNEHEGVWRFNAALMFKNDRELAERCAQLQAAGVQSPLLQR